jgi:hypothetical protein
MPEPLIITISHRLGRDEARRRVDDGLARVRRELTSFVRSVDYSWTGYRLNFSLALIPQSIHGQIDVEDDLVRLEIQLPLLLRMLAARITARVRTQAGLLLGGPPRG